MAGEDNNAVPIIGSDSERRGENGETRMGGEEDRHKSEPEDKEDGKEEVGIKSVEEGEEMDGGGWAWVVVLGELYMSSQIPLPNPNPIKSSQVPQPNLQSSKTSETEEPD